MPVLAIIGLILFMLMGLIVAFKGFDLLKNFIKLAGGVFLAVAMLFFGMFVGAFLGAVWTVILALVFAIIGFVIGYLIAPTVLWLVVAIIVFSIFWSLGWSVADRFGAEGLLLYVAASISGIIGAYLFSILARKLMVGATSALGGLMFAVALFILLVGPLDLIVAGVAAIVTFIFISMAGYLCQSKKGRKGRKGDRKK